MTKRKPEPTRNDSPALARLIEDLQRDRERVEVEQRQRPSAVALPTLRDGLVLEEALREVQAGDEQPLLDLLGARTGRKSKRGRKVTKDHLTIARAAEALLMRGLNKTDVCDVLTEQGIVGPDGITPTHLDRSIAASRAQLEGEYAAEVTARIERSDDKKGT